MKITDYTDKTITISDPDLPIDRDGFGVREIILRLPVGDPLRNKIADNTARSRAHNQTERDQRDDGWALIAIHLDEERQSLLTEAIKCPAYRIKRVWRGHNH